MVLEGNSICIDVDNTGRFTIYDKIVDVEWEMGGNFLFGTVLLETGEKVEIDKFELEELPNSIVLSYTHPKNDISFKATLRLIPSGDKIDLIVNARAKNNIEHIEFLKNGFTVEEAMGGFYLLPLDSGRFLFADTPFSSDLIPSEEFSMSMYGIVNDSSLLLSVWDDPSLALSVSRDKGTFSSTFVTFKTPQRVQFRVIPEGSMEVLAEGYREYVMRKGYIVPWEEKGKNREYLTEILKGVIIELEEGKEELVSFVDHLRNDMRISQISFLTKEEKDVNEVRNMGYPVISPEGDIRSIEIDKPLEERRISKEDAIVFGKDLKERLLPDVDIYIGVKDILDSSFFPLFEMVYGDTVVISKDIENFSDIDKELLISMLLGRLPVVNQSLIPQGKYWELEDDEKIPLEWEKYLTMFKRPSIFMTGKNGWGENAHPFDIFLKNLEEIFIPFRREIFGKKFTRFEHLDEREMVLYSAFGDVEVTVNFGNRCYELFSLYHGRTFLPPYGFIVASESFLAFYAYGINDYRKEKPLMVSVRTLDGQNFKSTKKLKVYHAFGPSEFKFMRKIIDVKEEKVYSIKNNHREV